MCRYVEISMKCKDKNDLSTWYYYYGSAIPDVYVMLQQKLPGEININYVEKPDHFGHSGLVS